MRRGRLDAVGAGQDAERLAHRLHGRAQQVVGDDHELDAGRLEILDAHGGVERGHHDDRRREVPAAHEVEDLVGRRPLVVEEDHVGARLRVRAGPGERLGHAVAGDERLGAGDDHEVGVALGSLGRTDLARVLLGGREFAPDVRVETRPLREDVVLDRDAGDARPLVLLDGADDVEGIAVAVVAVGDDRHVHGVVHVPRRLEVLGHREEVHVRHRPLRGGHGEARCPHDREAGLLGEPCAQRVVRADRDGRAGPREECPKRGGLGRSRGVPCVAHVPPYRGAGHVIACRVAPVRNAARPSGPQSRVSFRAS